MSTEMRPALIVNGKPVRYFRLSISFDEGDDRDTPVRHYIPSRTYQVRVVQLRSRGTVLMTEYQSKQIRIEERWGKRPRFYVDNAYAGTPHVEIGRTFEETRARAGNLLVKEPFSAHIRAGL